VHDEEKTDRAIRFVRLLKHTKGKWAGKPFNLLSWQENEILRPLFVTVDENGYRLYRKCYVEIPKKKGLLIHMEFGHGANNGYQGENGLLQYRLISGKMRFIQ
jgi:hypothetical protein